MEKSDSRVGRTVFLAALVVWLLAPVVLIAVVQAHQQRVVLVQTPEVLAPVTASVESAGAVEIAIDWGRQVRLIAPGWSGTVEQVHVEPGDRIEDGSPVITIDGIERRAALTPRPFTRPLSIGDRGADVRMLHEWLAESGYPGAEGEVFTAGTMERVRALAADIGAKRPSAFDWTWLVYLPEEFTVGSVEALAAAPAPAAGEAVVLGAAAIKDTLIVEPGSVPERQAGEENVAQTAFEQIPADAVVTVPVGAELRVRDEPVVVGEDGRRLENPDVLERVPSGAASVPAVLVYRDDEALMLPSAAVWVGAGADTCVLRVEGDERVTVSVTVASGANGQALVTGDLSVGDRVVLAPPAAVRGSC
ncbi:hypothetical protein GCG21_00300 [Pseudactinotalea sp. HY160]|uniref:hypothetical protein n=1 Tax=Pseudactinotalea sp. HY160 TaxID=2654490 RepID=UPI00128C386D|nr:hypothetical protein [Pseudactinotalea sp. HY160]MPV48473.1 hypothetical protein [Pseudactinotalea sp. HY160]